VHNQDNQQLMALIISKSKKTRHEKREDTAELFSEMAAILRTEHAGVNVVTIHQYKHVHHIIS
jgi:hypothetical protein